MTENTYIYNNKAAVLEKINKPLKVKKLMTKKIARNQLLIRVKYTFVCGSQLNEIFGKKGKDKYLPHTLGHEAVGIIIKAGSKITKFKNGDTVIISWIKNSKLECANAEHLDIANKKVNSGPVSTFVKFAITSESRVYKINSKKLKKIYALYGCAMPTGVGIALQAMKNLKKNNFITIYGLGGIGLIVFATLKYFGYKNIIAVEKNKERLKLLKKLGCKLSLNLVSFEKLIHKNDIKISEIKRSIDTSGNIFLMRNAFKNLSKDGKFYIAGNPSKGEVLKIDPYEIIYGKRIFGSIGGNISIKKNIKLFDRIVEKNPYLFKKFIDKSYNLEEINLAIKNFLKGKIIRPLIKI